MAGTEAQVATVRSAVAPALAELGLRLYDVELQGQGKARTLRVTVERDHPDAGEAGIDLDAITAATKAVSPLLDAEPSLSGPYLLEVSSPGVERTLRTAAHFAGARGETVTVKFHTPDGPKRVRGTLTDTGEQECVVDVDGVAETIRYADVTSARTVFEWGAKERS